MEMTNDYIGRWISLKELKRDIRVGDFVMVETLEDTLVVEVSKISSDNQLWHFNDWIIPKHQIVAIKKTNS